MHALLTNREHASVQTYIARSANISPSLARSSPAKHVQHRYRWCDAGGWNRGGPKEAPMPREHVFGSRIKDARKFHGQEATLTLHTHQLVLGNYRCLKY